MHQVDRFYAFQAILKASTKLIHEILEHGFQAPDGSFGESMAEGGTALAMESMMNSASSAKRLLRDKHSNRPPPLVHVLSDVRVEVIEKSGSVVRT